MTSDVGGRAMTPKMVSDQGRGDIVGDDARGKCESFELEQLKWGG
jgi:hypothetical protein